MEHKIQVAKSLSMSVADRINAIDWEKAGRELNDDGCAVLPGLLDGQDCRSTAQLYDLDHAFRSRIVMENRGYGRGEYRYFSYPLPPLVASLRCALYPRLAAIANRWREALKSETVYPASLDDYLVRCHQAGQTRPTPLLLKYGEGDFNCLHQDVYGEHVFPLQVAVLLSGRGRDFSGGEFVLTEQRPRMQSRVEVVPLEQGDAVIFPVRYRPKQGTRGIYRVAMRHGVSRLRSGQRFTLGIIFHDAK